MSKELIVSLNGREKKIAIIEDGRVTEFYIERGQGGQGIVGNIYKGRVMRVLPGMQSAFVDIGLDRDGFLYVSDFFDEEEEFERIVVDRSAKGEAADAAARAARERVEQARVERERQMESAQELAAVPVGDEEAGEAEEEAGAEASEPAEVRPEAARPPEEEERGGRGRRGRGRDRRPEREERRPAPSDDLTRREPAPLTSSLEEDVQSRLSPVVDLDTPFVVSAGDFQRVADDEEGVVNGEMFKDARLQERLSDQIRGFEFDMDAGREAEVGSVLASAAAASGFERVADDEEAAPPRAVRSVQPAVAAAVSSFAEEILEGSGTGRQSAQTFERVADDEEAGESRASASGKSAKSRGAAKGGKKAAKEAAAAEKPGRAKKAAAGEDGGEKEAAASKKGAAKKGAAKGTAARGAASKSAGKSASKGRAARKGKADGEATGAEFADAEAGLSTRSPRGEFARRGGRRRRRKPEDGEGGVEGSNGHAEHVGETEAEEPIHFEEPQEEQQAEAEVVVQQPARAEAAGRSPRAEAGGRQPRAEAGRDARGERPERGGREGRDTNRDSRSGGRNVRGGRDGRDGRDSRDSRDTRDARSAPEGREGQSREGQPNREGRSEGRDNRGGGGGGRRGGMPMITDLLREGQEILVQIAKEPIAAKGARITSHIALPGRYLVYMPTIEHVGVSRKIESDSERARLRKLIKDIRETEDVPSGGFIVRTAGVGITEQNLRDDARYLVRTWRDIRKQAEKTKGGSLVHADLDLVQRILRDQLSEEFTAIRCDSEEEYQEIVEFVNRIQPRLVNRVKLYTRDQPILEAFGVQAEIDKAIKPRVWLKSGGYLVINQTEALVAIDVNTGKFVGRGGSRLEDTITKTNLEAVDEIARQIRLRDLGGIIVLDLIDMEDRRNRNRVMGALQDALRDDKSPTKVLSINDFGLVIMTRKRVKQSLERTLCSPCPYCTGAGLVKSPQTVCYEILEEARSLARGLDGDVKQTTLRVNPEVAQALRTSERDVLAEIEEYLGPVDLTSDKHVHQEQFDFAFI